MSDVLFPEVVSKFIYSSRAEQGVRVKGFLDGSGWVLVVLTCWGQEEEEEL